MSKNLKNIGVVAGATTISRLLGMVRDQVAAAVLGGHLANDAFLTAFSLPNLFRRLLGEGSLTAAFVPTLQEELRDGGEKAAFQLLNQVVSWLALISGGLVALAMLGFSQSRLLPGHEGKWYLAADLTVIMFPYLFFISLAAAFNATLNVLHRFTEPALSPIWLNIAMIVSLGGAGLHFASTELGEVHWLCAGVLIGGFFQMTVPAVVLIRLGWRPGFALHLPPGVKQIGLLMLPGLLGTAIYQINIFVSRVLAFSLPESSATMMFYANRLMELPIGVFAIAVATVVYPLIAKHAAQKNEAAMARDFHRGLRLILAINVPAAAGLALLSEPIVRLLYQRGQFTAENTSLMSSLLTLFVIGMPLFSITSLTVRAFYSIKDTRTPVRIAVVDFFVNLVLSLVLKRWLGAYGLVLASTCAILVQTVLLQRALEQRLPGLGFGVLWPTVLKIAAGTAVMAGLVWFGWRELQLAGLGRWADVIAVAGLIPLGVAVYGATLWALRIEGREELWAIVTRRRLKPE
ncbi:MAG TPA: murein biosynthesis integral membrane protein MurJ [Candidatus Didemnitutus sp.]|nr:murein biosynthesis integral membrane protein MurJ [Candidatus Didemnitutus sp.]